MKPALVLTVVMTTAYMGVVQGDAQCGDLCVLYKQCPHLNELLNSKNLTAEQTDLLRKSFCGFQDNSGELPKVCCTSAPSTAPPGFVVDSRNVNRQCYDSDGLPGECVGVNSCPRIKAMLVKKPWPKETIEFVRNLRCEGPETHNVCCQLENPIRDPCMISSPLLPKRGSGCCGTSTSNSNRISGGNTTNIDQYPWTALLEYKNQHQETRLDCGGTLISNRYVMTAGHCVKGSKVPVNIRLGEYDTSNEGKDCVEGDGGGEDCTDGITIIPIEKIIVHPQYDPHSALRRHDIALIRMRWSAPYTDFIRPICLPSVNVTSLSGEEVSFWAAGWGQVDKETPESIVKRHVQLPYIPLEQCQPSYNVSPGRIVPLSEGQICAGGEKEKDTCKGDSGGPLMYLYNKVFELVGVVSFGVTPCGLENVPGVYTNVYEYYNWTVSNIEP